MLVMPTIEYNVVENCNLACQHCDHASPFMPRSEIAPATIARDLTRLAEVARFGELKLVGGEPLLHSELLTVLKICKAAQIASKTTLATNGVLLHRLTEDELRLIDQLWISIYPSIKKKFDEADLQRKCGRTGTRVNFIYMGTFRKTITDQRNLDRDLLETIFRLCPLRQFNWCHTVRQGRYYICSPAPFIEYLFPADSGDSCLRDSSLDLYASRDLRADLLSYVTDQTPLSACQNCLGGAGRRQRHRLMSRTEVARGFESNGAFIDDLDLNQLEARPGHNEPDFTYAREAACDLFCQLSATQTRLDAIGFVPRASVA